ncbi:hypothetical protein AB4Y32_16075 [Paraburkholderia phymatum]|uniref:Uncharacterized protein n=1 Tax=Paraburkholderia phymatum TaxID=148447 RepID=A0ACC6U103_9BURK
MSNFLLFAAGFLLGASAFGMLAILMIAHRPPSITKASRKPVDVQYTHRQYRDAEGRREDRLPRVQPLDEAGVGGIRYEFMGVGNEDV